LGRWVRSGHVLEDEVAMKHQDREMHTVCPHCLRENDLVTEVVDEGTPDPYPGALSFCIRCGHFAVFQDDLSLRKPTLMEQWEFDNDAQLAKVRWAWRETQ
jgi:hypothetical protein